MNKLQYKKYIISKQKKERSNIYLLFILVAICVSFFTIGYALFGSSMSLSGTGVISTLDLIKLPNLVLNNASESGLYSLNNRYIFSGSSVENYLKFNNETWRILSIEEDNTVRIIKDSYVDINTIQNIENQNNFWLLNTNLTVKNNIISNGKVPFDFSARRPLTTIDNSYCNSSTYGCNAYSYGTLSNYNVDADSLIKIYLENGYYNSLSSHDKAYLTNYNLNVGLLSSGLWTGSGTYNDEQTSIITSKIGLATVSDYQNASTDALCGINFELLSCNLGNWLDSSYQWYLLNGKNSTNYSVWTVNSSGKVVTVNSTTMTYLRPVLGLNGNVSATGSGTNIDPYILGVIIN